MALKDYEFWLIVGSQHLYGEETLRQVKEHAQIMTEGMNRSGRLPCSLVLKPVAKTPDEITEVMRAANADSRCAGVIVWMHTFSPSKMWIGGLSVLQKPYCHFATQFNRNIPNEGIDMDFMNLNQSAHGDREHGFIAARMRCRILGRCRCTGKNRWLDACRSRRSRKPRAEGHALWR